MILFQVAVVISTVFIGIEIMQTQPDDNKAKHVWAPITLAAIFAYMTIDCFIGVYGVLLIIILINLLNQLMEIILDGYRHDFPLLLRGQRAERRERRQALLHERWINGN